MRKKDREGEEEGGRRRRRKKEEGDGTKRNGPFDPPSPPLP